MSTAKRIWPLLAAAMALPGCYSAYKVDVRNMADQPITVALFTAQSDGEGRTLDETRIGPGDRASVSGQTDGGQPVALQVDFEGNLGYPPTIDVAKGLTVINVVRTDEGSKGHIRLIEVPRP
jgi:hypothetical protein